MLSIMIPRTSLESDGNDIVNGDANGVTPSDTTWKEPVDTDGTS